MDVSELENKNISTTQVLTLRIQIAAAAVASSFILILIPNIETITFTAFLLGYVFKRKFAFETTLTMVITWEILATIVFSFSNITFFFKLIAWLLITQIGRFARNIKITSSISFAIFGGLSAIIYDLLVTIPYAIFFIGQKINFITVIISSFVFGIYFTLSHVLGNAFFFSLFPRIISSISPILRQKYPDLIEIGDINFSVIKVKFHRYNFKNIFIILSSLFIIAILITGIIYYSNQNRTNNNTENNVESFIQFSMKIDFAGLTDKINLNLNVSGNTTVFDALITNFQVNYTMYGTLAYVRSINNVWENVNITGYYWIYYINGNRAQIASNSYSPSNGDIILWIYEK